MDKIESLDHQPRFEGFSIVEYSERYGIPTATAQSRIAAFVRQGKLQAGWRKGNRKWYRVYRAAE